MLLYNRAKIESVINIPEIMDRIEAALVQFSQGEIFCPPIGTMSFQNPPGDVHIKHGAFCKSEYYVVKIASGFYENRLLGFPSSNGVMLIFCKKSGQLEAILQDEGYLTDLRTGIVGAICAKYLAPQDLEEIGILGTGTQARMQLDCLQHVVDCKNVVIWGRNRERIQRLIAVRFYQVRAPRRTNNR